MTNKTSVQLYYDYKEQFELLTDSQMRKVIYAMIEYDEQEKTPRLDKVSTMAFSFIKKRIDYDKKQYNLICERNQKNGVKGGRPKNPVGYLETQINPKEPKKPDIDIDIDIDIELDKELDIDINNINNSINKKDSKINSVSDNKIEDLKGKEKTSPAGAPTHDLFSIIAYGKELGANDEYCEKFFNHYESIGWVNGSGLEIKNWKLVLKNWVSKDKEKDEPKEKVNKAWHIDKDENGNNIRVWR